MDKNLIEVPMMPLSYDANVRGPSQLPCFCVRGWGARASIPLAGGVEGLWRREGPAAAWAFGTIPQYCPTP